MPKWPPKISKAKNKKGIDAYFLELKSPLDLARYVCDFGSFIEPINAVRSSKDHYILFSRGEKIGKKSSIYYAETKNLGKIGIYRHGDLVEDFYMIDNIKLFENFKYYRIPIIEIERLPFNSSKAKADGVTSIEIKDFDSMVKEAISIAVKTETIAKLYAFFDGSKHILGAFDIMNGDDDNKIFWYSTIDNNEEFNFLRYDYNSDIVEEVNVSDENPSFIYVKVINLAEKFPFF
jgi:hypothetical protein